MVGLEHSGHVIGAPPWHSPSRFASTPVGGIASTPIGGIASTPVGGIASTPVGGIGSTPVPWARDATPPQSGSGSYAREAASNGRAPVSPSTPVASAVSGATGGSELCIVVTGCVDEKLALTVRGTFQQVSTNHGKPVFKRIDAPAGIGTAVLIYYWDNRDGPDMCGWWFGPEVGGDQVWAFNGTRAPTPPGVGWKIPFDGDVDPTMRLRVVSSSSTGGCGKPDAVEEPATKWPRHSPTPAQVAPPPSPGRPSPGQPATEADGSDWDRRSWNSATSVLAQANMVPRVIPPLRVAPSAKKEEEDFEVLEARMRKEAEDAAAQAVRRAIQRMDSVTPETLEQLSVDLNRAQAEHWDKLGPHQQKVADEISAARLQAQERLLRIQGERAEAERVKREEEERLGGLLREASEQATHAESQVKDVLGRVTDLKEMETFLSGGEALEMAQSLREAYHTAQKLLEASLAGLDGTGLALEAELATLPPASPSASVYAEARTKLAKMQSQSRTLRNSLEGLTDFVPEVLERSIRRVDAERRQGMLQDLFSRYDADGDGRLNTAELIALARHEYHMDLSEGFLSKARRYICRGGCVPFENFRRLRQMLGVECSEVRLREAINAEEERKRREQEEVDRQRRDIADRKQRAQLLLDDASEFLSEAVKDLPRAEEAAKPLLAEERLGSDALEGVLAATDAALSPLGVALPGARSKLKEAIQVLGEDLRELFVAEMIRIEERLRREEERDEVIREAVTAGRERAKRRAAEEEKSAKNRKAVEKMARRFQDPDESSDDDFDF